MSGVQYKPLLPMKQDVGKTGKDPYGGIVAKEAKDGRPWRKCCEECAFRDDGQREEYKKLAAETDTHFYCIHQEDGPEHRVCAGFAAHERAKQAREGKM